MSKRIPMTVQGAAALKASLKDLKSVKRPKIISAIAEARQHGDLKENSEYHAAREQQSFTEGLIKEIEIKLSNCQVIDVTKIPNTGKVIFGSTVTLLNTDTLKKSTYQIVGEDEADIQVNKISIISPIARGLIGKTQNSTAKIITPSGVIEYSILEVQYI